MILSEVFERFVEESPVSVMARATLENALTPTDIDALFEDVAREQYTRELLFSDVVDLMALVVCKIRPSINNAYKKRAQAFGVTRQAVYDKINRTEPAVAAALVRHSAAAIAPVIAAMGGGRGPWLPGYRVRILDGNHLPGTEHRLKPLRTERAAALPGQALVVFDPEAMLAIDAIGCEDGHAQERSLTAEVLAMVRPGEVGVGDRNFCTTPLLFGIVERGGSFVIRQHGSTLSWEAAGPREATGRCDTGAVVEQRVRLTDPEAGGRSLVLRRITVELDQPTRDGDREIHILTDLPEAVADAIAIADLYRRRWTLETASQEIEATLRGEIDTLAYPRAALFGLCAALVAYNVLSAVKAALRSVHGPEAVDGGVSGWDLAEEVAGTTRGMRIAIPQDEWVVFHGMPPSELGRVLQDLARRVRLSEYRKQPRGPKKPRPQKASGYAKKHLSTARLLKERRLNT
jgi:hypothetical protein